MSTIKTKVKPEEVVAFLKKNFDSNISSVNFLKGGELSQACSFSTPDNKFIIRINKNRKTYDKDKYAFEHFANVNIPIPEILEIGQFNENLFFAISKMAKGKTFDELDKETTLKLLPKMINTLDEIHNMKIKDDKYGYWGGLGRAAISSWKEFMLHRDDKLVNTHPEDDLIQKLHQSIQNLVIYLPEGSYLVHGDYGFNNLVTDGEIITGVLDWGESVYGDFIYDLAWLTFWPSEIDFADVFKKHYQDIGKKVDHFEERLRCYQLQIGLGSLGFFAKSEQKDDYDWTKDKLLQMLDNIPQKSGSTSSPL